jgi:hypothetical protein
MLAVEGVTATAMVGVGFGVGVGVFGLEEVPPPELQEARMKTSRKKGKTWRGIVRLVCGRGASWDNCTGVQKRSKEKRKALPQREQRVRRGHGEENAGCVASDQSDLRRGGNVATIPPLRTRRAPVGMTTLNF